MEEERCQLECRWVHILCILPDKDGRRRETMREEARTVCACWRGEADSGGEESAG